ncbi:MAG: MBL fold metallo-hydrolase [Egibacteraceae bacterium]
MNPESGASDVNLKWFGTNGWEIAFGSHRLLIDPYLTRYDVGIAAKRFDPATPLWVDHARVDRYVSATYLVLLGHGHFDHINDVPYVVERTGARVLGTQTHANLLYAMGVPTDHVIVVQGGEFLAFDGYTIEVFPSLHGVNGNGQYIFPGTLTSVPPKPTTIADLVEGGTLIYQVTIGDRFRILALSSGNFIERELRGLRPDVVIAPTISGLTHGYAQRLLDALGNPRWLVPTHWDNFELPVEEPAIDEGGLAAFIPVVREASPQTRVVALDHLESFTP